MAKKYLGENKSRLSKKKMENRQPQFVCRFSGVCEKIMRQIDV